jgi:hypothetical protein
MSSRDHSRVLAALGRSSFRSAFRLGERERGYLAEKGMAVVLVHARDMVRSRLGDAAPKRDGKQTPYRGHPVFVAQHATGTCCRSCLSKWHRIGKGRALSEEDVDFIVSVIAAWLERQDVV